MAVLKSFAVAIDTELANLHHMKYEMITSIAIEEDHIKFCKKYNQNYSKSENNIAIFTKELDAINARIKELNAVYNRNPWTRAFLVINSNGHVHRSMNCQTCFDSTRYTWLVQYSNDDEATIVSDAGETACTVCYPTAPAEVLNRPSRIVTADRIAKEKARAEREAKRTARLAKEKANAATASGDVLKVPTWTDREGKQHFDYIKTERTAVSTWANNYYWINNSNTERTDLIQANDLITNALAEKHGVSVEEMTATLTKKALASIKRAN